MPNGADDLRTELRNDFAQMLAAFDGYDDEPEESIAAAYLARAEELIELLPDPVRRLAILEAMGLDVHPVEGRGGAVVEYVVRPRGAAS